jgi:hypothetical protein
MDGFGSFRRIDSVCCRDHCGLGQDCICARRQIRDGESADWSSISRTADCQCHFFSPQAMPDTTIAAVSGGVVVPANNLGLDGGRLDTGETDAHGVGHITSNGTQPNGVGSRLESLRNVPGYTATRKLRVVTIGAGFSGLILAHKLRYQYPEMQEHVENIIFEARHEVGGTWLVNNYPGCQCDVPSHIYAFPFDPNPNWSHFYSTASEIQEYIVRTIKKWDLGRDIRLNTRVTSTVWREDLGQWQATVECDGNSRVEYADVVISGRGFLNSWKWPTIPGLETNFKGHKVHSASWDHSYDYSHRRIAVIGNGSSGIQILPKMARLEGTEVISFQRNPSWIVARLDPGKLLGKPGSGDNPLYTEEEKTNFRTRPEVHREYRKTLVRSINKAFRMVRF